MPERSEKFDAVAVRDDWDIAADAYADAQATGRDYYRLEFFGPAQVALCGEVQGLRLLDVGCGTGYFSREMARRGAVVTGVDRSTIGMAGMSCSARQEVTMSKDFASRYSRNLAASPFRYRMPSGAVASDFRAWASMPGDKSKVPVVGVLNNSVGPRSRSVDTTRQGLRELGYVGVERLFPR